MFSIVAINATTGVPAVWTRDTRAKADALASMVRHVNPKDDVHVVETRQTA